LTETRELESSLRKLFFISSDGKLGFEILGTKNEYKDANKERLIVKK
jgi:hypothetical protein